MSAHGLLEFRNEYPLLKSAFLLAQELLERTNPDNSGEVDIGPTFDTESLRRFQWTGIVAADKKSHMNKLPCHSELEQQFADFLDSATDVVRYLKNERFGFSVTYYENSRPRQYYPDFIVIVRGKDGRDIFWLVETKGEIRPNTVLKREAAQLWCEKMSSTLYGTWKYLFVQQREFERVYASGMQSFAQLVKSLTEIESSRLT